MKHSIEPNFYHAKRLDIPETVKRKKPGSSLWRVLRIFCGHIQIMQQSEFDQGATPKHFYYFHKLGG